MISFFKMGNLLFRPPFINGRPQDSDSVFWKKKGLVPFFEVKAPLFFIYIIFIHIICQGSPGVTRGHQERFPWVPLGSLGFPWVPLGSLGFPWVPLGSQGNPREPKGTQGNPREPKGTQPM